MTAERKQELRDKLDSIIGGGVGNAQIVLLAKIQLELLDAIPTWPSAHATAVGQAMREGAARREAESRHG